MELQDLIKGSLKSAPKKPTPEGLRPPPMLSGGLPFVVLVPSNIHRDRARGEWLHFHATASRGCFPAGV